MVRISLKVWFFVSALLMALTFGNSQSGQKYFGRTLDNSIVGTSDIQDTSISDAKIKWLNPFRFWGNPTNSYGPQKPIYMGYGLGIASGGGVDSLKVTISIGGGGSGDVNQNGNSYGATMRVGTNDNNNFQIETNNTGRLELSSGATTGGNLTQSLVSTNTNAVNNDAFVINHTSTGTVTSGFGTGLRITAPSSTGVIRNQCLLTSSWFGATNGSETGYFKVNLLGSGTANDCFTVYGSNTGTITVGTGTGLSISKSNFTTAQSYTIGGSANQFNITSTAAGNQAIYLQTNNQGSGTSIWSGSHTATSPTAQTTLYINGTISATGAGTNSYKGIEINNTYSSSGGNTSTFRGLHINNAITLGAGTARGIDISNTVGDGIYQNSVNLINRFGGKTVFGSTNSPVVSLQVINGRFATAKGLNVASANVITLGTDGNSFQLTGTTSVHRITTTDWPTGSEITLLFASSITIQHNSTTPGGAPISLSGSVNYGAVNGSQLKLMYDGTAWHEQSRKHP
ncbi:MAG: hypothetical protein HOP11_09550 [Saprospiraceae bacterium]|nr:hypothetical protein [Saprospiraceae bacterium]